MTYDHELTLVKQDYVDDEIGNRVPTEVRTTVFCGVKSIGRTEFYNAAMAGLKPEIIFVVHTYEYNGEQMVEFDGELYKVARHYAVSFEEVELTCEKVMISG